VAGTTRQARGGRQGHRQQWLARCQDLGSRKQYHNRQSATGMGEGEPPRKAGQQAATLCHQSASTYHLTRGLWLGHHFHGHDVLTAAGLYARAHVNGRDLARKKLLSRQKKEKETSLTLQAPGAVSGSSHDDQKTARRTQSRCLQASSLPKRRGGPRLHSQPPPLRRRAPSPTPATVGATPTVAHHHPPSPPTGIKAAHGHAQTRAFNAPARLHRRPRRPPARRPCRPCSPPPG